MVAGMCSWLKSPLHSVLVGSSIILYLLLLRPVFLKPKSFIFGGLAGVLTGISLFLPIIFADLDNFWQTYILRETFHKQANGVGIGMTLVPILSYQLLPWSLLALASIVSWRSLVNFMEKTARSYCLGYASHYQQ